MPQYTLLMSHSGITPSAHVEASGMAEAIALAERMNPGKWVIWGRQTDCQTSPPKRPIASLWGGHR